MPESVTTFRRGRVLLSRFETSMSFHVCASAGISEYASARNFATLPAESYFFGRLPSKSGLIPSILGIASIISGCMHAGSKNLPSGVIINMRGLPDISVKNFINGFSSVSVIFRASGYDLSTAADSTCDSDSSFALTAKILMSLSFCLAGIFKYSFSHFAVMFPSVLNSMRFISPLFTPNISSKNMFSYA